MAPIEDGPVPRRREDLYNEDEYEEETVFSSTSSARPSARNSVLAPSTLNPRQEHVGMESAMGVASSTTPSEDDAVAAKRREAFSPGPVAASRTSERSSAVSNTMVESTPSRSLMDEDEDDGLSHSLRLSSSLGQARRQESLTGASRPPTQDAPQQEERPQPLPTARRIGHSSSFHDYDDDIDDESVIEGEVEAREVQDLDATFQKHGYAVAEAVRPDDDDYFYYDDERDFDFEHFKEELRLKDQVERRGRRRTYMIVLCITLILVAAAATAGAIGTSGKGKTIIITSAAPTFSLSPSSSPTMYTKEVACRRVLADMTDPEVLDEFPPSPQGRALKWLAFDDTYHIAWELVDEGNESVIRSIRQRYILATLFFSTGGAEWTDSLQFLSSEHECKWNNRGNSGVFCDHDIYEPDVIAVSLANHNANGTLPPEIGFLNHLLAFSMVQNHLRGPIPAECGALNELSILHLNSNQLTGTIPSSFANLVSLEQLNLSKNQLSGEIPSFLFEMPHLHKVNLEQNDFVGNFGPTGGDCPTQQGDVFVADCHELDSIERELTCECCTQCCEDLSTLCYFPDG